MVHRRGFGGNHHVRLDEGLKFAEQLGDDLAVLGFHGELDGADFDDFIFLIVKTGRFKVECYEFWWH